MEQQNRFIHVLTAIRTVTEADQLQAIITTMLGNLYKGGQNGVEETVSQLTNQNIAQTIRETLLAFHLNLTNREEMRVFLEELQKAIQACEVLGLTVAFEPTDQTINRLHSWFLTEGNNNTILLEITVSTTVIGGAIIIYKGKYKDYSLKQKLTQVLATHKEEIMKLTQ